MRPSWTAFCLPVVLLACDLTKDDTGTDGTTPTDTGEDPHQPGGEDPIDADGDGHPADVDCDDTNASVNPAASEICDGIDNNCDGATDPSDAADAPTWYADLDGDGFGDATTAAAACEAPSGTTANGLDCDDTNSAIHPDAPEVCDGDDNDCDTLVDDADDSVDTTTGTTFFLDHDGDGYGDAHTATSACTLPSGYVANADDCDDASDTVHPDAPEVCGDGIDNDCGGPSPECTVTGTFTPADVDHTIRGTTAGDEAGRQVATIDLDGDGTHELVVGAPYDDGDGEDAGQVAIFNGLVGSTSHLDTHATTLLSAGEAEVFLGYDVADAGDVNGDGYHDLLAGGYRYNNYAGAAYLVYGGPSALASGAIGDVAHTFTGLSDYDDLGHGVRGLGDLDGDGYADIGLGAPFDDDHGGSSGSLFIYYGGTSLSGSSVASADLQIYGASASHFVGFFTSFAGSADYNGDGYVDLAVGAYGEANADRGAAYVYYGAGSATTGARSTADADVNFIGEGAGEYFGRSVTSGDLTGDGYDDLLVWAYYGDDNDGAVYVFAGSGSGWSGDIAASTAHTVLGGAADYDYFGRSLSVGDTNGDGLADLLVGAGGEETGGSNAGATYLYYGPFSSGGSVDATDASLVLHGDADHEQLGFYGVTLGDISGDGVDDIIAGARGSESYAGETLILFGGGF